MPRFVEVESPYMGDKEQVRRNILYARACVRDCFERGEIPFASHLLYTQPGITDDNILEERTRGIGAARDLVMAINMVTVVYEDLGVSNGMRDAIALAVSNGRIVEYRHLNKDWEAKARDLSKRHSQSDVWGFRQ